MECGGGAVYRSPSDPAPGEPQPLRNRSYYEQRNVDVNLRAGDRITFWAAPFFTEQVTRTITEVRPRTPPRPANRENDSHDPRSRRSRRTARSSSTIWSTWSGERR